MAAEEKVFTDVTGEFTTVKQFPDLYKSCLEAQDFYTKGEYANCKELVGDAFFIMMKRLSGTTNIEEGLDILQEQNLLTELSMANYGRFLSGYDVLTANLCDGMNAYNALVEEVHKFAQFYVRGISPKMFDEIMETKSDGVHSARGDRMSYDGIFSMILIVGFFLVGITCLILSTKWFPNLLPAGIVTVVFAGFLIFLKLNATK